MAGNFQGISFGGLKSGYGSFKGIIISYDTDVRLIKVTDWRGSPLENCLVTVQNSGGDFIANTDDSGIASVEVDVAGSVNVICQKNLTNKSITYTYASEGYTKTIVLQPPIM